jgi:hypothetical protein
MTSVDVITRDSSITPGITFDAWIAGFTPSESEGHVFYALTVDSMRAVFDTARGVGSSTSARRIGWR